MKRIEVEESLFLRLEEVRKEGLPLRKGGLSSKENFRWKNYVWSIIDTTKLEPQDKDPKAISNFVREYVTLLNERGISAVEVFAIQVVDPYIVVITRYIDRFLDELVLRGEADLRKSLIAVLEKLSLTSDGLLGIDPSPKNFAVDPEGNILYADLFYPFTRGYVEWSRSRMDSNNQRNAYVCFSQDSMFFPLNFAHAASDFIKLKVDSPEAIIRTVSNFCQSRFSEVNFFSLFESYKKGRRELKV